MKIITISRQFGSGGRELGKRLAEAMHIPCYDHQIIEMIAEREKLDQTYVANMTEKDIRAFYPATIARGFSRHNPAVQHAAQLLGAQQELIQKLASEGDCVIVGRAADIILADRNPFRIYVCASDVARVERCMKKGEEGLSEKDILKKCRQLDRRRQAYRKMFTDARWNDAAGYQLCVNTSGREIKQLIPGIVAYINQWYTEE